MEIKIGKKGVLLNGEYKNWNIYIQDLDEGKGPYLILLNSPDGSKGYDDWVENKKALQGYFRETNWNVSWRNAD